MNRRPAHFLCNLIPCLLSGGVLGGCRSKSARADSKARSITSSAICSQWRRVASSMAEQNGLRLCLLLVGVATHPLRAGAPSNQAPGVFCQLWRQSLALSTSPHQQAPSSLRPLAGGILIEVTLQGGQRVMPTYLSHLAEACPSLAPRKMSYRGNLFSSWGLMRK